MKDHEIRETVSRVQELCFQFRDSQQLRGRIANFLVPVLKAALAPSDAAGAPMPEWGMTRDGAVRADADAQKMAMRDYGLKDRGDSAAFDFGAGWQRGIAFGRATASVAPAAVVPKGDRDTAQLADWLLTDPETGETLHFAGPLEPDFLRFSRVRMESKSGTVWTLSARLQEGYLTAAERLANIKRAAKESGNE